MGGEPKIPHRDNGQPVASIPSTTQMASTATALKAPRVLLVDDDGISLELTTLLLAGSDAQVECALGGQQALERLRSAAQLPDVVLVDRQMPDVSGADVANFILTLPRPRPRVIAISASPLPPGERALFDHTLLKPLDREQLRAAVAGSHSPTRSALGTPASQDSAALDPGRLRQLQQLMPPAAVSELYSVYLADTRQRIAELERCFASGDRDGLRRCAHAIKGSSAMIGVPGIATCAARLESEITSQQEYSKLFLNMRSACDDVERCIAGCAAPGEI